MPLRGKCFFIQSVQNFSQKYLSELDIGNEPTLSKSSTYSSLFLDIWNGTSTESHCGSRFYFNYLNYLLEELFMGHTEWVRYEQKTIKWMGRGLLLLSVIDCTVYLQITHLVVSICAFVNALLLESRAVPSVCACQSVITLMAEP